jgi:hypothetical protein
MTDKKARGRLWFKETVCKNCTNFKHCDKYGIDDLQACIEAEKLRFLKTDGLDIRCG